VFGGGQAPDRFDYDAKIKAWYFEPSVDVKLGVIMPHQLLGYLRAGVAINKIELTTNDRLTYRGSFAGLYQSYTLSAQDSPGTKAHLRLGGGLDFEYTPYNTFNLSYVYTYYGKFNASSSLSTTDIAGRPVSFSDNTKFRLATNTVTIGYTHYFSHA
jgi:opacity protein-like surface antigen